MPRMTSKDGVYLSKASNQLDNVFFFCFAKRSVIPWFYNSMKSARYEHLADGSYELKEEHAQDCAQLLAGSFSTRNVVWSQANLELLKLKQFFLETIKHHLYLQKKARQTLGKKDLFFNTILTENGYLTACALHYDIEQYREELKEKKTPEFPLFRRLEQQGAKLLENVDLSVFETGKAVYCSFGTHSTGGRPPTIAVTIGLGEKYTLLRNQGIRYVVGRLSNEKIKYVYLKFGAKIVSEAVLDLGNGKEQKLYYFIFDMENPTFLKLIDKINEFRAGQRAKL